MSWGALQPHLWSLSLGNWPQFFESSMSHSPFPSYVPISHGIPATTPIPTCFSLVISFLGPSTGQYGSYKCLLLNTSSRLYHFVTFFPTSLWQSWKDGPLRAYSPQRWMQPENQNQLSKAGNPVLTKLSLPHQSSRLSSLHTFTHFRASSDFVAEK